MMRILRFAFAPVLSVLLAVAGLTALAPVAPARAAEPSVVFAVLDVLTQRHVANPDPAKLLDAANARENASNWSPLATRG